MLGRMGSTPHTNRAIQEAHQAAKLKRSGMSRRQESAHEHVGEQSHRSGHWPRCGRLGDCPMNQAMAAGSPADPAARRAPEEADTGTGGGWRPATPAIGSVLDSRCWTLHAAGGRWRCRSARWRIPGADRNGRAAGRNAASMMNTVHRMPMNYQGDPQRSRKAGSGAGAKRIAAGRVWPAASGHCRSEGIAEAMTARVRCSNSSDSAPASCPRFDRRVITIRTCRGTAAGCAPAGCPGCRTRVIGPQGYLLFDRGPGKRPF